MPLPSLPAAFNPQVIRDRDFQQFWTMMYPWLHEFLQESYAGTARMMQRDLTSLQNGLYVRSGRSIENNIDPTMDPRGLFVTALQHYIGEEIAKWARRNSLVILTDNLEILPADLIAPTEELTNETLECLADSEELALQVYKNLDRGEARKDCFLRRHKPLKATANPQFKSEECRTIALDHRGLTAAQVGSIYYQEREFFGHLWLDKLAKAAERTT